MSTFGRCQSTTGCAEISFISLIQESFNKHSIILTVIHETLRDRNLHAEQMRKRVELAPLINANTS